MFTDIVCESQARQFYSATTVTAGHLDKVDQSDYRKITIHSNKVGCGPISSS